MIIVDNIAEYETLSTIKNFCKNHDECKGCLYNFMCSFFNKDIVPENWEIKLELKKEELFLLNLSIVKLIFWRWFPKKITLDIIWI